MKYRISKKIGTYSMAGVLLANNVPVFANNTASSETASIVDEKQSEDKEIEYEKYDSYEENTENILSEKDTEATTQLEETKSDIQPLAEQKQTMANIIESNVPGVTGNTLSIKQIELETAEQINFEPDAFTLYGENNPTKDKASLEANINALDGTGYTDTNQDGYIDLDEKISQQIKRTIKIETDKIGTQISLLDYKIYTINQSVNNPIVVNEQLKTALNTENNVGVDASNLTYEQAKTVTKLDLSNSNLTELEGIQYFQNVEEIDLSGNQLTRESLKPLLTLKNLKVLNLSDNNIDNFGQEELANLTALEELDLSNNNLTIFENVNVASGNLDTLNLNGNNITEIKNINIPSLKSFKIEELTELGTIENVKLPKVTTFNISYATKLAIFRRVDLASLESLEINSNALNKFTIVNLPNAYRLYINKTTNPTGNSEFTYVNAPNVTEINSRINAQYVRYVDFEKYSGEFYANLISNMWTEGLNVPNASTVKLRSSQNRKTSRNEVTYINIKNATSLETTSDGNWAINSSIFENINAEKITELKSTDYVGGLCEIIRNINAPNVKFIKINSGGNNAPFENINMPNLYRFVEGNNSWNGDAVTERVFKNVNFDALSSINNNSGIVYQNTIRLYEAENLSIRKVEGILANKTDNLSEGFAFKNVISPELRRLDVSNKADFANIDDILNYPKLEEIIFNNTGVTSIEPFELLPENQIKKVILTGSKIKDIGPLKALESSLVEVDTTGQRIDYLAYKEGNTVTLTNPITDSAGLINADEVKITNISNGGRYDEVTKTITWDNVEANTNIVTFSFSAPYTLNEKQYVYSGTATVALRDSSERPPSVDVDIQGVTNKEMSKEEAKVFNLRDGITLTNEEDYELNIVVSGFTGQSLREDKYLTQEMLDTAIAGKNTVYRIKYQAINKTSRKVVKEVSRRITVTNGAPVFNGVKDYYYYKAGDKPIDFKSQITIRDEEDGPISSSQLKVTINGEEADAEYFKKITEYDSGTREIVFEVTDNDNNTVTKKSILYVNETEVNLSTGLENVVKETLRISKYQQLKPEDIVNITSLDLTGITDLTGIESLKNLKTITFNNGDLSIFKDKKLLNVETFNANNVIIPDNFVFNDLNYPSLKNLTLTNSNLDDEKVKTVINSNSLTSLNITNNAKLESITALNTPKLETLRITDLYELNLNLPKLTTLEIGNLDMFNADLPMLTSLELGDLESFSGSFNSLTSLTLGNLGSNFTGVYPALQTLKIGDIQGKFNCTANNLQSLTIGDVQSITGTANNLNILRITGGEEGTGNTTLTEFNFTTPNLTELYMPKYGINGNANQVVINKEILNRYTKITVLDFEGANSTKVNLDGVNLENLTGIGFADDITELPNMNYGNITSLNISGTQINKLDNMTKEKFPMLTELYLPKTLMSFTNNELPKLTKLNMPSVEEFNNNQLPNLTSITLPDNVIHFNNNDLVNLSNLGITNNINLETMNYNKLISLSGDFKVEPSKLKEMIGNDFSNIEKFWVTIGNDSTQQRKTKVVENTFGNSLYEVVFRGEFEEVGGIRTNNQLKIYVDNASKIGTLKDIDAPNATRLNCKNSTIDTMLNLNLPSVNPQTPNNEYLFQNTLIKNMINVNFNSVWWGYWNQLRSNRFEKLINLYAPGVGFDGDTFSAKYMEDVTFGYIKNGRNYFTEAKNLVVKTSNGNNLSHLDNKGIEYLSWGEGTLNNKIININNNKIWDMEAYADSLITAEFANPGGAVYGQTPEITVYYTGNSKTLTYNEIFKLGKYLQIAKEKGRPISYRVISENSSDTENNPSNDETGNGSITFNNLNNESNKVFRVEVSGKIDLKNHQHPIGTPGSWPRDLSSGSNKTIVTIRFEEDTNRPLELTGVNDKTINVGEVDSFNKTGKLDNVKVVKGDVEQVQETINVTGIVEKPVAGTNRTSVLTYTIASTENESNPVTKTRIITVTNQIPTIKFNNLVNVLIPSDFDNNDLLIKLKQGVTASDLEDNIIDDNIEVYLKTASGEEIKVENNNANTIKESIVEGNNTFVYKVTDSDKNTITVEKTIAYSANMYMSGVEDEIITVAKAKEYNAEPGAKYGFGVVNSSEGSISSVNLKKLDGTLVTSLDTKTAINTPADYQVGMENFESKYNVYEATATYTSNPQARNSVDSTTWTKTIQFTNYAPRIDGLEDKDNIEIYQGERIDLLSGVSAMDVEDGAISTVTVEQIDTAKLKPGNHPIAYTVKDSDNNFTTKTINIKILPARISITTPGTISISKGDNVDIVENVIFTQGEQRYTYDTLPDNVTLQYKLLNNNAEQTEIALSSNRNEIEERISQLNDGSYILKYIVSYNGSDLKVEADRDIAINTFVIEDMNLIKAINRQLGRNENTALTYEDMANLTTLNASNCGIKNLKGLEFATNLQSLDLSGNKLSKVDLSFLANLKEVDLSNNFINNAKDVVFAPGVQIDNLNLSNNFIDDIDNIQSIKLESLDLSNNNITDIALLNNINTLVDLNLANNQITTINSLNLPDLQSLDLTNNALDSGTTGDIFNNLTNLKKLKIGRTGIDSLSNLNLPNLETLEASNNGITSIENVTLPKIKVLNLANNSLQNIDFLIGLEYLEEINVEQNLISNIDGITLKKLNASNNPITMLSNIDIQNISLNTSKIEVVENCNLPNLNLNDVPSLKVIRNSTIQTFKNNNKLEIIENVIVTSSDSSQTGGDIQITSPVLEKIDGLILPAYESSIYITGCISLKEIKNVNAPNTWRIEVKNNCASSIENIENVVLSTVSTTSPMGLTGNFTGLKTIRNVTLKDQNTAPSDIGFSVGSKQNLNFVAPNIEVIDGLSITGDGASNPDLTKSFTNTTGTRGLIIFTNISLPNATNVRMENMFNEDTVVKSINLPVATNVNLQNNNIANMDILKNVNVPQVNTLNLSNNRIIDATHLNELLQCMGILTDRTVNVDLRQNKILAGKLPGETIHNIDVTSQQIDSVKAFAENATMEINVKDVLQLQEGFNDVITVTNSDNDTFQNDIITWNNVQLDANKTFTVELTKASNRIKARTAQTPYYSSSVTVTPIDSTKAFLQFKEGQENITVKSVEVQEFNKNLTQGLEYVTKDAIVDNIPENYVVEIADGSSVASQEISLQIPEAGTNKTYNLIYSLIEQDTQQVVSTATRKVTVTNQKPRLNDLQSISIKTKKDVDFNKDELINQLKQGVIATDFEDGEITEILDKEPEKGNNGIVLKIPQFTSGENKVIYEVYDRDGNKISLERTVTIALNQAPVIEINTKNTLISPSKAAKFKGSDLVSEVIDDYDTINKSAVKEYVENGVSVIAKINAYNPSLGTQKYNVKLQVTDSEGVTTITPSITVTISNEAPTIKCELDSITAMKGRTIDLLSVVEITDDWNSFERTVTINGQKIENPRQYTVDLEADKVYPIVYTVIDSDGNKTVLQRNFNVAENIEPEVVFAKTSVSLSKLCDDTYKKGVYLKYGSFAEEVTNVNVKNAEQVDNLTVNTEKDIEVKYQNFNDKFNRYINMEDKVRTITVTNYVPKVTAKQNVILREGDRITKEKLISFLNITDEDSNDELIIDINKGQLSLNNLKKGTYNIEYIITDTDGNTVEVTLPLKVEPKVESVEEDSVQNGEISTTISENVDKLEENKLKEEVEKQPVKIDEKDEIKPLKEVINLPKIHEEQKVEFNDITESYMAQNSWAVPSIEKMSKAGILKGDGKGNFNANQATKRADVTIMLVNLLGLENEAKELKNAKTSFTDVRQDKYYANYVELATQYGIISGVGNGKFNPEATISRQDVMVMISRVLKQLEIEPKQSTKINFSDENTVSDYAKESIDYLVNLGIIKGNNNKINPKQNITRAEMSVILDNVYTIIDNQNK